MADIIEGIHPTRMELLEINERIKLAEKGHKLLKERRDSLITKFFEIIDKTEGSREELISILNRAYSNLIKAGMIMSKLEVDTIASITPESKEIKISTENILGVRTPRIEIIEKEYDKKHGVISASSVLDESTSNFEDSFKRIINLIEMEEKIRRLGNEIKKTKRRVNALEYLI
ncbi:MAG: V-type ATP synthase subunit D, partial [Candidatus Altiarchaeales archaeon]